MVHREERRATSLHLRRLASGRITTREHDDARVWQSPDPAVVAISDAGWGLYGDFSTYRLRGDHSLPPETMAAIGRCVLFLDSDLEYEWPTLRHPLWAIILGLISLGQLGPLSFRGRRRWKATGDHSVWPFFRRSDYKVALSEPRFLTGHNPVAA